MAINEFTSPHWLRPDPVNPSQLLGIEVLQFRYKVHKMSKAALRVFLVPASWQTH